MKSETYLICMNSETNVQVFNSLQLKFGLWFRPNYLQIIVKSLALNCIKSKLIRGKSLMPGGTWDNAITNPDQRLFKLFIEKNQRWKKENKLLKGKQNQGFLQLFD